MTRIQLRGIQKRYGDAHVLRDVSLSIEPGEFCVFIGPSGCGKSTLLRLIAGLDDPSGGDIQIDGVRVNDLPPARRNVAMVFQSYALYPHMTVFENMAFGLRHLGLPKQDIDARVSEAARILHLGELLTRRPRDLSGGQRQRVAIGRAIVRQPKVFLFDEPLSNLDAALRVKTRVEIARLHRGLGSVSMVYVTHDQVEAMTLADRIVLLRPDPGGSGLPSVAQVGSPLTLYHHPANRFVAGFIGSPAMNFLPAAVASVGDGVLHVRSQGVPMAARVDVSGLPAGQVREGAEVMLGIRPEHVQLGRGPRTATVAHVEHLGEHSYAYLQTGDDVDTLVAKTDGVAPRIGDTVAFDCPADRVHVFRADGQAVPRPGAVDTETPA